MKQVIVKSILLSAVFLLLLCKDGISQLGIGTSTPSGLLDLRSSNPGGPANTDGFLAPRVSAFPATNPGAAQNGLLLYLTTAVGGNSPGFYVWDNPSTSWKKLTVTSSSSTSSGFNAPLVNAGGGTNLIYTGAGGWTNNVITPLMLNEISDVSNIYDPATGVITIAQSGLYLVQSTIVLDNDPGGTSTFNGVSGTFTATVEAQSNGAGNFAGIATSQAIVIRGVTVPGGTHVQYTLTNRGMVSLQQGDKVRIQFLTFGTDNMNGLNTNVILDKGLSTFKLFKL